MHRLDKDTTGLMVVAKTDAAHKGLSRLFEDHGRKLHLVRDYMAFVWGAPDRARGVIDAPVGRHATHRERMAVVPAARGREAVTHFETLEDFGVAALVGCRLETGRTHQISVHMAHIGHPLIGDATYGAGFKTKSALLTPRRASGGRGFGPPGAARGDAGLRASGDARGNAVRKPVAEGFGAVAIGSGGAIGRAPCACIRRRGVAIFSPARRNKKARSRVTEDRICVPTPPPGDFHHDDKTWAIGQRRRRRRVGANRAVEAPPRRSR